MKNINKGPAPALLTHFRQQNPNATYRDLENINGGIALRTAIRQACITEQYYLCAYCCDRIDMNTSSHNEHITSQHRAPQLSLNFNNIVASCNDPNHCGRFKDNNLIPITPLMANCEQEIKYNLNGQVTGITPAAIETVTTLGLDKKGLSYKRKQLVDNLIYSQSENPNEIELLENDLIQLLIESIDLVDNGKMEAFSPIVISILYDFIN